MLQLKMFRLWQTHSHTHWLTHWMIRELKYLFSYYYWLINVLTYSQTDTLIYSLTKLITDFKKQKTTTIFISKEISTYINTKMSVCLSVCSRFSRPFRNPLGYPWHKVSFRWDSKSEWESDWDSGSESGSQTGSQSGSESGSGCELESEEESERKPLVANIRLVLTAHIPIQSTGRQPQSQYHSRRSKRTGCIVPKWRLTSIFNTVCQSIKR